MSVVKNLMVRVGADLSRFNTAFSKAAGITGNFSKQTQASVKEVAAEMKGLKIAAIECGKSNTGIVSITDQIRELKEEQAALQSMGFSWGFTKFEENEVQLRSLTKQLNEYKATLATPDVSTEVLAQNLRNSVDEAQSLGVRLQTAKDALKQLESAGLGVGDADWDDMYQTVSRLTGEVKDYKASLAGAGNETEDTERKTGKLGNAVRSAFGWLKRTSSGMLGLGKSAKSSSGGMEGLVRSLKRISLVSVGLQLTKAVFGELRSVASGYISENAALQAQVSTLKSSLGQALAPAINLVTNALSTLMPYVVGVSNAIGSLITNLFGSGWTSVADDANAAATAIGGAGSAQKEFNRTLAGFDEITKLNQESSNSGSGGSGSSASTATVEAKTPTWLTNLTSQIQTAFGEGDFFGIGEALANTINAGISNVKLSDTSLGSKISGVINDGIQSATGFVENLDWSGIGTIIKTNISDLFGGIDWKALFKLVGASLGGIGTMLWSAISDSLESARQFFEQSIEDAGGDVVLGILNGIGKGILNIGTWITDNIFSPFVEGFKSVFKIHSPSSHKDITSLGENIIGGIFNGITTALGNVGSWIKEHIFTPISEGLKAAFSKDGLFAGFSVNVQAKLTSWKDSLQNKVISFQSKLTTWKDALQGKVISFQSKLTTWKDALQGKVISFQSKLTTWKDSLSNKAVSFQAKLTSWKESLSNKFLDFKANIKKGWTGSLAKLLGIDSITSKLNMQLPKISVDWGYVTALGKQWKYPKGFDVKWNAQGGILNGAQIFGRVGNTLLGGGEAGREAVLPLDRNTGWMDKIADRVALKVVSNQVGGQDITINLVLDGKVITKTVVHNINSQARATGKNPLAAYI